MQIDVATRHGSLSDETRERVAAKAKKLQRFFDRLSAIEVIIDLSNKDVPIVDLKVSAEHKHDFVAHCQDANLWAALDATVQKLEQQVRKYTEKVQERSRNHDLRRHDIVAEPNVPEAAESEFDVD